MNTQTIQPEIDVKFVEMEDQEYKTFECRVVIGYKYFDIFCEATCEIEDTSDDDTGPSSSMTEEKITVVSAKCYCESKKQEVRVDQVHIDGLESILNQNIQLANT